MRRRAEPVEAKRLPVLRRALAAAPDKPEIRKALIYVEALDEASLKVQDRWRSMTTGERWGATRRRLEAIGLEEARRYPGFIRRCREALECNRRLQAFMRLPRHSGHYPWLPEGWTVAGVLGVAEEEAAPTDPPVAESPESNEGG